LQFLSTSGQRINPTSARGSARHEAVRQTMTETAREMT